MPAWRPRDIKIQFERARRNGWDAHFAHAAHDYDFTVSVLMAVASRETNMQNIVGDGGHGYGIMQIDDRSFPDWCHSGIWKDVHAAILKGAQVLDSKREAIRAGQGKRLRVGDKSYVGAQIASNADLLRISLASYNSGGWAYYYYSTNANHDPDSKTTEHNYSADTLAREAEFGQLGA